MPLARQGSLTCTKTRSCNMLRRMALKVCSRLHSTSACKLSVHGLPNSGSHGRSTRCCCNAIPSHASVFTAARLNASALRIMGPGSPTLSSGFGKIRAMDEFFIQPLHYGEEFTGPDKAEFLIYFLEERLKDSSEGEREFSMNPRHGIQVWFQTCMRLTVDGTVNGVSTPVTTYVREAFHTQSVFLETGNGKGGAKVRVIAGKFAGLCSTIPSQEFVFLDIFMRPGSETDLPVNRSHGLVIYILEGAGIFKWNGPSAEASSFYENEGHGIWFPPWVGDNTDATLLHVSTHLWSGLRFLLLGSSIE